MKSRPRRQGRRSRIADVDEKVNGILDILSSRRSKDGTLDVPRNGESEGRPNNDTVEAPVSSKEDVRPWKDPYQTAHPKMMHLEKTPIDGKLDSGTVDRLWNGMETLDDEVEHGFFCGLRLRMYELQYYMDEHRRRQSYFPFVVIPDEWTANYMLEYRPFLLLAIATVATSAEPLLQDELNVRLMNHLANAVVIEGNKSLDLLQGLLVYLAWFHFFWVPRSQRLYGHVQIALAMVIDLGLDQSLRVGLSERSDLRVARQELLGNMGVSAEQNEHSVEAQRAALGCSHLSSIISAGVGKPNHMKVGEYMLSNARMISKRLEIATDALMEPLISLDQIVEHTRDLYREEQSTTGRVRLPAHAERMLSMLNQWHCSYIEMGRHFKILHRAYRSVKVRILEMGLVYRFGPGHYDMPATLSVGTTDPKLITNLTRCIDAAKSYLDGFLELSESDYHSLPLEDWLRLIQAPFILYRLCVGVREVPDWTPTTARSTIDFEHYLDQIQTRLEQTIASTRSHDTGDLFSLLPLVFQNAKQSFDTVLDGASPMHVRAHQFLGHGNPPKMASSAQLATSKGGKLKAYVRCPATTSLPRPQTPRCPLDAFEPQTLKALSSSATDTSEVLGNDHFWTDLWAEPSPLP